MRTIRRRTVAALALIVAGALAACGDSGPSGAGAFDAAVEGPLPLGAVVMEVRGTGITGFEAGGTNQVFSHRQGGTDEVHRVVLVGSAPGTLDFRIEVSDVSAARPVATVLVATGGDNRPILALTGINVDVSLR